MNLKEVVDAINEQWEKKLENIRTEIEDLDVFYDNDYFSSNQDAMFKCNEVLAIFDKYKVQGRK